MKEETGTCRGSACQSCGMTIESGAYCPYCTDADGHLQEFSERLARMSQWLRRETPDLSEERAEALALDSMSSMPAWRDHPEILKHRDLHES